MKSTSINHSIKKAISSRYEHLWIFLFSKAVLNIRLGSCLVDVYMSLCVDNSEVCQVLVFKYCTKTKEISNFTYPDF